MEAGLGTTEGEGAAAELGEAEGESSSSKGSS
jgi:hypothetical protein